MKRQLSHPSFVEVKQEEKKKPEPKPLVELDAEDYLWIEILKTLDKLEKGVEGDLSALARSTRNINKFRKRLPSTTWIRILHCLIPINYRNEFLDGLKLFINDIQSNEIKLISSLSGVTIDEAKEKLNNNNDDVFKTIMQIIDEKERLAKIEIKKRQQQLKKERLEREKKKGIVVQDDDDDKNKKNDKMDVDTDNDAGKDKDKDDNAMDIDDDNDDKDKDKDKDDKKDAIRVTLLPLRDMNRKRKFYPETYIFLQILIGLELYDRNKYSLSLAVFDKLIKFSILSNRRTSDILSSRVYQYYGLASLRLGNICNINLRNSFYKWYQKACIQQNTPAQSILIVLVLQCYISSSLYNLGSSFILKTTFPLQSESQYYARYHYYCGIIDCVSLNYSDALYNIEQSIRRSPQTGCYGFKLNTIMWLIVIKLLMGDIPDRNIFLPKFDGITFQNQLKPFYDITECVIDGNLNKYNLILNKYNLQFKKFKIYKILCRLRHNVIKTGLRRINQSYSAISLKDISTKLSLLNERNAYFIVSKAIHDNIIYANINYNEKYLKSKQNINIYNTNQPYNNFKQRIKFCLNIRNNAVKSLRYPPNNDLEDEKNKKDKDKKQHVTPEEIAEMIQKHFQEQHDDD